jgi:hypothetical protein
MEHALRDLRALDSSALFVVATDLAIIATAQSRGGKAGEKMPDEAAALLLLGRVAYVIACEGKRG